MSWRAPIAFVAVWLLAGTGVLTFVLALPCFAVAFLIDACADTELRYRFGDFLELLADEATELYCRINDWNHPC